MSFVSSHAAGRSALLLAERGGESKQQPYSVLSVGLRQATDVKAGRGDCCVLCNNNRLESMMKLP